MMHSSLSSGTASIVTLAGSSAEESSSPEDENAGTITFTDSEGNVITSVMGGDGNSLNLNGVTVVTGDQLGSFLSPVTLDGNGSISLKLDNKMEAVEPSSLQTPFELTVKTKSPIPENEKKICLWPVGNGSTCGKAFAKFDSLKRHLAEAHKGVRPFACRLCDKSYGRRDYLQRHLKSHNASYAVNLATGGNAASLSSNFRSTTKSSVGRGGGGETSRTSGGGNALTSIPFLNLYSMQHQQPVQLKPLGSKICRWVQDDGTVCGKAFSKLDSLRRHVNELHKCVRPFACSMCEKNYGRKDYLDRHLKTHDPSVQRRRPGMLEWGSTVFGLLNNIKEEDSNTAPVPASPPKARIVKKKRKDIPAEEKKICLWVLEDGTACGKTFTKFDSLKRHVSEGHKHVRPFSCALCGKSYGRRDYLLRHLRSHNESDLASLVSGTAATVRTKMSDETKMNISSATSHDLSGGQLILGNLNGEEGSDGSDNRLAAGSAGLGGHLPKRRMNEKKTCRWVLDNGTVCGRSFSKFDSLRRHVQELHKGVRPFVCQLCQKSYGRKDYLDRHVKSHEDPKAEPDHSIMNIGDDDEETIVVTGASDGMSTVLSSDPAAAILSDTSEMSEVSEQI